MLFNELLFSAMGLRWSSAVGLNELSNPFSVLQCFRVGSARRWCAVVLLLHGMMMRGGIPNRG